MGIGLRVDVPEEGVGGTGRRWELRTGPGGRVNAGVEAEGLAGGGAQTQSLVRLWECTLSHRTWRRRW